MVRPLDGVTPYRLEMQAKATVAGTRDLYEFWGDRIYRAVAEGTGPFSIWHPRVLQMCRKISGSGRQVCDLRLWGTDRRKVRQKGTLAKMARGEMVRYLAQTGAADPEDAKGFDHLGYRFREELSGPEEYVFIKE